MKQTFKGISSFLSSFRPGSFLIILVFLTTAAGCGRKAAGPACPFSSADWTSTVSDILETEGRTDNVYQSVYGGDTYVYPASFQDQAGSVKYMFDEKDRLACISWTETADSEAALRKRYDRIKGEITDTIGSSGTSTSGSGNYGTVWYLDSGNIILSLVSTDDLLALQYSYIDPGHSDQAPDR